jgi:hypothetical protein
MSRVTAGVAGPLAGTCARPNQACQASCRARDLALETTRKVSQDGKLELLLGNSALYNIQQRAQIQKYNLSL